MAVHSTFSRNWIFLSGFAISGNILQKGFITSRNLTVQSSDVTLELLRDLHSVYMLYFKSSE